MGRGSNVGLMWCSPFVVRLMVHTVGSLCNGLIRTDSARSMNEDTFGMRRPECTYSTVLQELAVKAVVVGTVDT